MDGLDFLGYSQERYNRADMTMNDGEDVGGDYPQKRPDKIIRGSKPVSSEEMSRRYAELVADCAKGERGCKIGEDGLPESRPIRSGRGGYGSEGSGGPTEDTYAISWSRTREPGAAGVIVPGIGGAGILYADTPRDGDTAYNEALRGERVGSDLAGRTARGETAE